LLIAGAIGEIRLVDALRDVAIILLPMIIVLGLVIAVPDAILALPRWIMPRFID
jgi:TRAP-type C4-dicarboxylate transport system permease large subunit